LGSDLSEIAKRGRLNAEIEASLRSSKNDSLRTREVKADVLGSE
jgi:hypothetical protein